MTEPTLSVSAAQSISTPHHLATANPRRKLSCLTATLPVFGNNFKIEIHHERFSSCLKFLWEAKCCVLTHGAGFHLTSRRQLSCGAWRQGDIYKNLKAFATLYSVKSKPKPHTTGRTIMQPKGSAPLGTLNGLIQPPTPLSPWRGHLQLALKATLLGFPKLPK